MISIGEFSRVSSLTVKTLRYYHEKGILMPEKIDEINGYRYYDDNSFYRAESIGILKSLGFSINEITRIFKDCLTDEDLEHFISIKIQDVDNQIKELQNRKKKLNLYKNITSCNPVDYSGIRETIFGGFWVCGIRFSGFYSELGPCYKQMFKKCGTSVRGKSMGFY